VIQRHHKSKYKRSIEKSALIILLVSGYLWGERTFSYKCKKLTLSNKLNIYNILEVKRNDNNDPMCGRKDVLSLFIIFKYFLSKEEFSNFFNEFKYKLQELKENEPRDIYFDILREMGLFNNKWEELNNIKVIDLY